jgi:hypothetical protein
MTQRRLSFSPDFLCSSDSYLFFSVCRPFLSSLTFIRFFLFCNTHSVSFVACSATQQEMQRLFSVALNDMMVIYDEVDKEWQGRGRGLLQNCIPAFASTG